MVTDKVICPNLGLYREKKPKKIIFTCLKFCQTAYTLFVTELLLKRTNSRARPDAGPLVLNKLESQPQHILKNILNFSPF